MARLLPSPGVMNLGWIRLGGPNMTTMCSDFDNSHYYYCTLYRALHALHGCSIFEFSSGNGKISEEDRQRRGAATAIFLPHACTVNPRALPHCLNALLPTDAPAVIFLNKSEASGI